MYHGILVLSIGNKVMVEQITVKLFVGHSVYVTPVWAGHWLTVISDDCEDIIWQLIR